MSKLLLLLLIMIVIANFQLEVGGIVSMISIQNFPHYCFNDRKTIIHLFHDVFLNNGKLHFLTLPTPLMNTLFCPRFMIDCLFQPWEKNVQVKVQVKRDGFKYNYN